MKSEEFDELIRRYNGFLNLDEENWKTKGIDVPLVTQNLLQINQEVVLELEQTTIELKERESKVFDKYKNDKQILYDKSDIKNFYIYTDDEVNLLKKKIAALNSQATYISDTLKNLTSLSFIIKNQIDIEKFYAGER